MRKVLFNGYDLVQKEVYGIHRYALELLKELDQIVPPGVIYVLIPNDAPSSNRFKFSNISLVEYQVFHNRWTKLIWYHWIFPSYAKKKGMISVDLTLTLSLLGSDIVCIHDCIRELYPQIANKWYKKITRLIYIARVKRNIKKAKAILTVSNYSKNDLVRIYHIDPDRVFVVPSSWNHFSSIIEDDSILKKLNLGEKNYFFSLGNRSIHKNFKWIVEAAKQNPLCKFVVTGGVSASNTSDLFLQKNIPGNLIFTGYLTDGEIKAMMRHCRAFILPSLYEGFGLPPLEAMSTGADCILSNASCFPEIYEKSVWYIDPNHYDNIHMDEIMNQKIASRELILQKYSWRKSAEDLLLIIKMVN